MSAVYPLALALEAAVTIKCSLSAVDPPILIFLTAVAECSFSSSLGDSVKDIRCRGTSAV